MRTIDLADISRVLITSVGETVNFDSWHAMLDDRTSPILSGMRLRLDDSLKNQIVSRFLGMLSYRSRERILRLLARLTGWAPSGEEVVDLFDCWNRVADEYLVRRESYYIKPERFEDWRRQMHALDEDLPALIHAVAIRPGELSNNSQIGRFLELYPTFLRGDDNQLYRELSRGIACLHLHLSGSYPSPYYWVGLMNHRFDESILARQLSLPAYLRGYRDPQQLNTIVNAVARARAIRMRLFHLLRKSATIGEVILKDEDDLALLAAEPTSDEIMQTCASTSSLDYAAEHAPGKDDNSLCPSLRGERWLLLRALQELTFLRESSTPRPENSRFSRLIWAYLVAKSSFLSLVEQAEGIAGFDYFEHTFRMLRWDNDRQRIKCAQEIGCFLQESGAVVRVEFMIAPQTELETYQVLQRVASEVRAAMRKRQSARTQRDHGPVEVGLIVHFIKSYGEPLSTRSNPPRTAYRMYQYGRREQNLVELATLEEHMNESLHFDNAIPIVGIDTANRELYCPPEVFAELFERARQRLRYRSTQGRYLPVRCTCHVGEDFNWLTTGLRRIFEAMCFLGLRAGDRLGHASALGLHPQTWIDQYPTIELALIDLLDDAIFERYLLRNSGPDPQGAVRARMNELELDIEQYSIEIFGEVVAPGVLERAWLSRGRIRSTKQNGYYEAFDSIPAWIVLQGEFLVSRTDVGAHSAVSDPRNLPGLLGRSEVQISYPSDSALRILDEYLFDKRTVDRFIQTRSFDTTNLAIHVERIQQILRTRISESGLTVESNPTSNWLIGATVRHTHVPAVRWLVQTPDFPITINPDDPTVFATSIENEYFFVYAAMVWGGPDRLSRTDALERISSVRMRGLDATFIE